MRLPPLATCAALVLLIACENPKGPAAPSADADLSALTADAGAFSAAFSPDILDYALRVPCDVDTVTVSGVCADFSASAGAPVVLSGLAFAAPRTASIAVTAEDGTTVKTYTVTAYRELLPLAPVAGGTFRRDGAAGETSSVSAFAIGCREITRDQFLAATGSDPSNATYSNGADHPVQNLNWYQAIAFCNMLSLKEGRSPAYSVYSGTEIDFSALAFSSVPLSWNEDWEDAAVDWSADGYRLPTEAEWQWAAMGAQDAPARPFAGSDGTNAIGDCAVFGYGLGETGAATAERTAPVGGKAANELGLFDASGNVWEWCGDRYGAYPNGPTIDYRGTDSGNDRVIRGGSWANLAESCSVSYRGAVAATSAMRTIGLRVVRAGGLR